VGYLGTAYAMADQRGEAHKMLDRLQELSETTYVSPYYSALIYIGLNETDQAFKWLEKANEAGEPWLCLFNVDPIFDKLRPHPRYRALVQKIGMEK